MPKNKMSPKSAVAAADAPAAIGPYSQAVRAGNWLFVSGQIAIDPASGALAGATVAEQTERALRNLGAIVRAAGLGYEHVVKTTVFLADMARFAEMNEAYGRVFAAPAPARATIQAAALPKGALVEIEAIAVVPDKS